MNIYKIEYYQQIPNQKQNTVEWNDLCEYVKTEILRYGDDKKFPKQLALRLKGVASNCHIPKNDMKQCYSYKFIKCVVVIIKPQIIKVVNNTNIKNENHLINLVCKLIDDNWNDACDIFQKKLDNKKELSTKQTSDIIAATEYQARERNKSRLKIQKLFKEDKS